jgi:hypothetical protein
MRQVAGKLLERDEETNRVLGFLPAAFAPRAEDQYLSLGWLEYFCSAHVDNAAKCKAAIQVVRKATTALHGVAQVGRVKALAQHSAKPVRLVYHPSEKNESHSALFIDMPVPDTACEALAREFFKQHY